MSFVWRLVRMGSFRKREREREHFESPEWEQRLIQMIALLIASWSNYPGCAWLSHPKEEEEKWIRTLSALSLFQRKRSKRSNGRWAFRTWSDHYYSEASSASALPQRSSTAFGNSCIVSIKGKRDLCEVHCIIDKVLWQVAQVWCCTCRLKIFR